VGASSLSSTVFPGPDAGHGRIINSIEESAGRYRAWIERSHRLGDIQIRNAVKPVLLPGGQIAALLTAVQQRLDELLLEAGRAVIDADPKEEPIRIASAILPFIEEASHLKYMLEFLPTQAAGNIPLTA